MTQHAESEYGLLGCCMLNERATQLCHELNVSPQWFADPNASTIYKAISHVFNAGGRVDSLSVSARLRNEGNLKQIGGLKALRDIEQAAVTHGFSEYHITILKDAYGRRELEREIHEIQTSMADPSMSAEMIAANTAAKLDRLFADDTSDVVPFADAADAGVKEWQDVSEGRAIAVPTGIEWLDTITGGIPERAVVIIQGPAGSSKTTLARMIAENVAKQGIPIAMRSLEQSTTQIAQGVIAAEAGICVSKLNLVPHTDKEKEDRKWDMGRIRDARERLKGIPFEINDKVCNASGFRAWAMRKASHGAKLILVDYLQRILPDRGMRPGSEEHVSQCSTIVYEVAKRTGVPVIAVCSENRAGTVRSSGQTEFDALIILRIRKSTAEEGDFGKYDPYENPCYIVDWVKARFAPAGNGLPVYWHHGRLIDADEWQRKKDEARHVYRPNG